MKAEDLKVRIFADGADIEGIRTEYKKGLVKGFTTNPTLMKKAGVKDFIAFAKEAMEVIGRLPLSLEVFADDAETMYQEARVLSALGSNIYVKIPIMNTRGESSIPLIKRLSSEGIRLNITAMMTLDQVEKAVRALSPGTENFISVFAGRVSDTGVDAEAVMKEAAAICRGMPGAMSLWASCREVYNIVQADRCGVDVITVTNDILARLPLLGKDLDELTVETIKMFVQDGKSLGYSILESAAKGQ